MKNFKKTIIIGTVLGLFVSCNKATDSTDIEDFNINDGVIDNEATYVELENSYNVLDWTPTVYHDFFKESENEYGINSLKNPLQESSIVESKRLSNTAKKGTISLNSKKINMNSGSKQLENAKATNIFGNTMAITIASQQGKTFKDGSAEKEISMYVPKELEIYNPPVNNDLEVVPYCFATDFVLEWNADYNNKEGLVVVADYNGMTAVPGKGVNKHITNTLNIKEDNGRAILDNDLWKGIPDTGIVTLSILRGNVKIEEIDEENYKLYALTQAVMPLVIIKNLNTIED